MTSQVSQPNEMPGPVTQRRGVYAQRLIYEEGGEGVGYMRLGTGMNMLPGYSCLGTGVNM